MKIIKQIVVFEKENNGYYIFLPEYPDIFTCGGPSKEDARYMIKDRLCCEVFWDRYDKNFACVTNKTIDDYKYNISKNSSIEEICFYYDIFIKKHWK